MPKHFLGRRSSPARRRRPAQSRPQTQPFHLTTSLERLDPRQLLAIDVFQYPVSGVTSGSSSYAVLLLDEGTNAFLKKNATPSPTFTYADNSQFISDPVAGFESRTFAQLPGSFGPLNTFYVTSGQREIYGGDPIPATTVGTTTVFANAGEIEIGTSDGIIPGTFFATVSIVDATGAGATIRVLASRPGDDWNLSIERVSGDGAIPTEGNVNAAGNVVLRGWQDAPQSVELTPFWWGVYTGNPDDTQPLSFTIVAGQTIEQRLFVDLSRNESTITINSPVLAQQGNAADPRFFSGSGGVPGNVGQVVLDASTIVTNANISSSSIFTIGVPLSPHLVSDRLPVRDVTLNRPVAAPRQQLIIEATADAPGRLLVSEQGALAGSLAAPSGTAAQTLDVQAEHADVVFAGVVNAVDQTYLLQSPGDPRAYSLTTVSPTSGVQAGRIIGDTVGVTLANDAGGEMNTRTTVNTLRVTAAATPSAPVLPYAIRVLEADDLVIDAVPASKREIEITAGGTLALTSAVETSGDVSLIAQNTLTLSSPISSAAGNVSLVSDRVTSGSPVTAGGTRGVSITSRSATGGIDINALVRAGGSVKRPVRVVTNSNVDLTAGGLITIDGVTLVAGDRVLVKNQTLPRENGIYAVDGAGVWSRATDASTSGQFVPGFSTYASEGSQRGGWVFANPANPSLGSTGLLFVPASATQTFADVAAATTADVVLSGEQTIDGVALVADQRVLVKNQSNRRQNGLYVVSAGAWRRAGDADTSTELRAGSYVFVAGGTANGSKGFVLDDDAVQLGVTELNFFAFAVQATRTNTYSPANVLREAVAATTVTIDLSRPQPTIDGQALVAGDLVLVKNQVNAVENGLYVVQPGGLLARSSLASASDQLARGTTVYVTGGVANAGTSWTFNDTTSLLGSIAVNNQVVTGLTSTARLTPGMLVTGPGIPSGTTIAAITGATSIRLSKPATLTDPAAALNFMDVTPVAVGTTPIPFVPTGGAVVVTAGESITSTSATPTSRLRGATALLTAGRPSTGAGAATSSITANTDVGRLSASAPAAVVIDNSGAVNLVGVGSSTAGPVTVTAAGTLTASSVAATGTTGTPGNVTLLATLGNVVAADVTSTLGSIDLKATRGDVRLTSVGPYAANVAAQNGSVSITAIQSPGDATGDIVVDGRLVAGGVGNDAVLKTSDGQVRFTSNAVVNAADQLLIDSPQAEVAVAGGAQIAASRLSLTARLGAGTSPPAALGTYQTLFINRTDAGEIDHTSAGNLVVEGAITTNGSIAFTAPDVTVAGNILPTGTATGVLLHATSGDVRVDAPLAASGTIRLRAPAGRIGSSAGTATQLVSSPLSLVVEAATAGRLTTQVAGLDAVLTAANAVLEVTEADSLSIDRVLLSAGGTATLQVGSAAAGGTATVRSVDVGGATGTLTLAANQSIVEGGTPTGVDIVANRAELTATNGRIDVDTDVTVLRASTPQRNQSITIDDLGASGLELESVAANNGDVTVTAAGTIRATSVATAGRISLTTTTAAADILAGSMTATGNRVTLTAGRSILQQNPATASLVGSDAVLTAQAGSIDLFVDVTSASAVAPETISLRDAGALQIAGAVSSNNKQVTLTVGGPLTQSAAIRTGGTLAITATGGDVTLTRADNDVGSLTAGNPGRRVEFRDASALDIAAAGITGGAVELTVGGPLTQTGAVTASSLAIISTAAGPISFTNALNDVDSIAINNPGQDVSFTNRDGVAIGTLRGRDVTINAGGALTQSVGGAITATGTFTVNFTGAKQPITLNGANDFARFSIDNGTQPVTLNDINDLEIGSITAGAVALSVGGNLTQTGGIVAPSLTASSTGGSIILGGTNDVGALSLTNPGRAVTFRDVNALGITALSGGAVQVTAGGNLTQSGAVTAASLRVDASAGDIVLTNAGNAVGSIAGSNPGRGFSLTNAGDLTQSAGIVAGTLSVTNTAGQVLLNAANDVDTVGINNGPRAVTFTDVDGVTVAALTGGATTLTVGGPLNQSGRITATSLAVTSTGGPISLTRDDNAVTGTFQASAPSGNVSFFNGSGLVAGRVVAGTAGPFNGNVHLKAVAGSIQLTDDVFALDDSVKLEARNGTITQTAGTVACSSLIWFALTAPTLNTSATQIGRNLTQPGATLPPIVDNSPGTIRIFDNSAMSGDIVVTAPNATEVFIDGALVAGTGGRVDLRGINPNAAIKVRGDGNLQGVQILVPRSTTTLTWIVSGATAVDAGTSLFTVFTRANAVIPKLATQSGSRIVAIRPTLPSPIDTSGAPSIDVQQSLPVVGVPVRFSAPATIRGVGAAAAGSGLRLAAGASGSQLTNLVFQGFAGTGIEFTGVQRALVQGVTVIGGTTGISVAGVSTGTRILGNTLRNQQTGLVIQSASRLTFGGRAAGQANRIENASREAVFATGFCTGTQLIKTQYVGGSSQIVQRNARGLRVVR